jgi:hypothetical protein
MLIIVQVSKDNRILKIMQENIIKNRAGSAAGPEKIHLGSKDLKSSGSRIWIRNNYVNRNVGKLRHGDFEYYSFTSSCTMYSAVIPVL